MRRFAVSLLLVFSACAAEQGTYTDPTPQPTLAPTPTPSPEPSGSPDENGTSAVVLGGDNLGVIKLGVSLNRTRDALERHLGDPDEIKEVTGNQTQWGTCPGPKVTGVRWATMWVLFSNESGEFLSFTYFDSQLLIDERANDEHLLKTDEGIHRGSTVEDLKDAYGARLLIDDGEPFGPRWQISDFPKYLGGSLTGTDDDDKVVTIEGGAPCGE